MIAVAADRIADIDLGPLVKIQVIVVGIFGQGPLVKELVHHNKAHTVGKIKKIASRIVAIANRIDAELSEFDQATFPNREGDRGTKCAPIVMKAHSLDLEVAPIHPETSGWIEVKFTNAERYGLRVDGFLPFASGLILRRL